MKNFINIPFHFQNFPLEIPKLNNASKLYIKLEDTLGFQITETLKKKEKEKEDPTKFERSEKTDRFHFQSFPLEIPKLNNASKLYIKLEDTLGFQIIEILKKKKKRKEKRRPNKIREIEKQIAFTFKTFLSKFQN